MNRDVIEMTRRITERRGYHVSLAFDAPVRGPIALGHSSHFGIELFIGVDDAHTSR